MFLNPTLLASLFSISNFMIILYRWAIYPVRWETDGSIKHSY